MTGAAFFVNVMGWMLLPPFPDKRGGATLADDEGGAALEPVDGGAALGPVAAKDDEGATAAFLMPL